MPEPLSAPASSGAPVRPWNSFVVAGIGCVLLASQLGEVEVRWFAVAGLAATACWLPWIWRRDVSTAAQDLCAVLVLLLSGFSAAGTAVAGGIPAILVTAACARDPRRGLGRVAGTFLLALLGLAAGMLVSRAGLSVALGAVGGFLLAVLFGLLRRQTLAREAAERRSLKQELDVACERALTAAAQERASIARDLHDVLAHTLGGLTIQLSALEAELEGGRHEAAAQRTLRAQDLARSGLEEARQAVAALREPPEEVDFASRLEGLLEQHRSLDGEASARTSGPAPLGEQAVVLLGVVRECLTNARRHAPGARTEVVVAADDVGIRLTASTPLVDCAPTSRGGGFGLAGLRDRVQAVGGTMEAAVRGEEFVVDVEAPA